MVKGILVTLLILFLFTFSTSKKYADPFPLYSFSHSFHYDSIGVGSSVFDSIQLFEIISKNNILLGIWKDQNYKTRKQILSDQLRKGTKFYVLKEFMCNTFKYLLIVKLRNEKGFDLKPHKALYLIRLESKRNVTNYTLQLAEFSDVMYESEYQSNSTSKFINDSVLVKEEYSLLGFDFISDNTRPASSEEKIKTTYCLSCDHLRIISRDTIIKPRY